MELCYTTAPTCLSFLFAFSPPPPPPPGAPLIIHTPCNEKAPFQILDVLEEAGADISRTAMSHLDRTFFNDEVLLKFAKRGCYVEFDMFGFECSHYQVSS